MGSRLEGINRFAPISGAPSPLIAVASVYFVVTGVIGATLMLISLVAWPKEYAELAPLQVGVGYALGFGYAAAMIGIGSMIGRRSRRGGVLAVAFVLATILSSLVEPGFEWRSVIVEVLSLAVIAIIWRDLR